ncbi:MAG: LytTR family DNA-binding domain-containing protein [Clostridiaceae bacterium]|nr:LytTR family DNA-binding domain-containing protein [Clostridiaceae bacterium]
MLYRIAICDDNAEVLAYLSSLAKKWADLCDNRVLINTYQSAEAFLFQYAEDPSYDILLLDIEMGAMNGVELARKLRRDNSTVQIVFITGFPDFIAEGYEVSALHYLLKPVVFGKLCDVLSRAAARLGQAERSILLKADGESHRIREGDIISVEAFAHTCRVTTITSAFDVQMSISDIEIQMGTAFIRCHRSYIVGVQHIRSITRTEITLDSGDKLPLSRSRYAAVNQAFIRFYRGT